MRRWVTAGLDPAQFWRITPREATVILEGADARAHSEMRIGQAMAHATAQLVAIAVNNPKKFPKFDAAFPDRNQKPQTQEQMLAATRSWVGGLQIAARMKKDTG